MMTFIGKHLSTKWGKICFLLVTVLWVLELALISGSKGQPGISQNGCFYSLEEQNEDFTTYICKERGETFHIVKVSEETDKVFFEITIEDETETLVRQAEVSDADRQKRIKLSDRNGKMLWEGTYNMADSTLWGLEFSEDETIVWSGLYNAQELAMMLANDVGTKQDFYSESLAMVVLAPLAGLLAFFFRNELARLECRIAGLYYRTKNPDEELQPSLLLLGLIVAAGAIVYLTGMILGAALLKA